MSFKPSGMPSSFIKTTTSDNTNKSRRLIDKLVTIQAYKLEDRQIFCLGEDGSKYIVQIRPEVYAKNELKSRTRVEKPKWEGYCIDKRMADSLPPGTSKIVLEKAETIKTLTVDGQKTQLVEADWIYNVTDPSPNKCFEGVFSINTYQNHVFHVQHWERKAISINDTANIERISNMLTEGCQSYMARDSKPAYGVQFRVIYTPDPTKEDLIAVDMTHPFDWVSKQYDDKGNEVSAGHPLNGDDFQKLLFHPTDGYLAYVNQKFPENEYPNRQVEVCFYTNYRGGPRSKYMAIPERVYDPMYQLANTKTKLAIDDQNYVQQKNYAVLGVLQLSSDQVDMATRTFKTRNIATRLHASGPKGHVHSWIRSANDKIVRPHELLRQVTPKTLAEGMTSTESTLANPAPVSQNLPSTQSASAASTTFDDWDNYNAFGGTPSDSTEDNNQNVNVDNDAVQRARNQLNQDDEFEF